MLMNEEEIYLSYRTAKRPSQQINILSELNAVPRESIQKIIRKKSREQREEDRHYRNVLETARQNIPALSGTSFKHSAWT